MAQHLQSFPGMHNLGMELGSIYLLFRILHSRYRANRGMPRDAVTSRRLCYIIGMAHPHHCCIFHIAKEYGALIDLHLGMPVFTDRRCLHLASRHPCDQL